MNVTAKAKFIRMTPKKVRLVINVVRGMDIDDALAQLLYIQKAASKPVAKLLESALANAEHNYNLARNNLYIKEIRADMGPVLKRFQPRAFGRAGLIRKRMSHISVVLSERVPTKLNDGKASSKPSKTVETNTNPEPKDETVKESVAPSVVAKTTPKKLVTKKKVSAKKTDQSAVSRKKTPKKEAQ